MNQLPEKFQSTFHEMLFLENSGYKSFIGAGFMSKKNWRLDFDDGCYNRYALVYVLHGAGVYTDCHGREIPVKTGDLFRRDSVYPHKLVIDPESAWQECYLTIIRPEGEHDRAIDTLITLGLLPEDTFVKTIGLHFGLIEEFFTLSQLFRHDRGGNFFKYQSDLLNLAVKTWFSEEKSSLVGQRDDQLVEKAKIILEETISERTAVKDLFTNISTGYSNLRRLFREKTGISPGDYRIKLRIDYACELLITTDFPVSEIAGKLGYHDQFLFSRQFKKYTGESPLKYRKLRAR